MHDLIKLLIKQLIFTGRIPETSEIDRQQSKTNKTCCQSWQWEMPARHRGTEVMALSQSPWHLKQPKCLLFSFRLCWRSSLHLPLTLSLISLHHLCGWQQRTPGRECSRTGGTQALSCLSINHSLCVWEKNLCWAELVISRGCFFS
jgi:hypothetical protein